MAPGRRMVLTLQENRSLSSLGKDFNYLPYGSAEKS